MRVLFVDAGGRLRVPWRLLGFLALFAGLSVVLMLGVRAILGGMPKLSPQQFVTIAVAATLAVWLARRVLDRRGFLALGLRRGGALGDLAFGTLLGVAAIGVFAGVALATGLATYAGTSRWHPERAIGEPFGAGSAAALAGILVLLAAVAWWEELVFRGYLLVNLAEGVGLPAAVAINCLLFGLAHAFNPGATALSSAILVVTTLELIYAYVASRALWLPVGLHLGWNLAQGSLFGFGASGNLQPSLWILEPAGPDWLGGGEFGPEGSVIVLPLTAATLLAIRWWSRRRDAVRARPAPLRPG